jgi:hypothetical protein
MIVSIRGYFVHWIRALDAALVRAGTDNEVAWHLAEDAVAAIQGGILLSSALKSDGISCSHAFAIENEAGPGDAENRSGRALGTWR